MGREQRGAAEELYSPRAPYLHVTGAGVSEATDFAWSLSSCQGPRAAVRVLRGAKMKTAASLFDEFAAALQFPYYFGENWDALDECITDLSWLPADAYILLITDAQSVLSEEDESQLNTLVAVLQGAGDEWGRPVETSEPWARPAVAFHVLFQCDEAHRQAVMSRLEAADASFREFHLQKA